MVDSDRMKRFIFLYSAYLYLNGVADLPADVIRGTSVYPASRVLIPGVCGLALLTLLRPGLQRFVPLLLVSVVSYAYRAPSPGNHDLLGFVLECTFLCLYALSRARGAVDEGALMARFAPVGRSALLVLYFYAVLHKLNWDYLDPRLSCGSVFLDLLRARPLSFLPAPDIYVRQAMILASLGVEVLIPLLLIRRGTAAAGALLGVAFHFALGYHFFWHFTPLLYALYFLWIPGEDLAALERRWTAGWGRRLAWVFLGWMGLVVALEVLSRAKGWHSIRPWFVPGFTVETLLGWVPFLGLSLGVLDSALYLARAKAPHLGREQVWPAGLAGGVPVLLAVIGGLPYLGYSNMLSFTMFSGLRTEGGDSNHVLIGPSIQISDNLRDVVVPLYTSPNLTPYLEVMERRADIRGRTYPWIALRRLVHMAREDGLRDVQIEVVRGGERIAIPRAEEDPLFAQAPTLLERKLFKFRAGPPPGRAEICAY